MAGCIPGATLGLIWGRKLTASPKRYQKILDDNLL